MSTDIIIAQQFWAWPDPVMKRDPEGRVLFVNAAFLHMYGGTVEAWTGNVLQGWSAPQAVTPGTYPIPNRFESRMPATDSSMIEQVYDWLELSEPNGCALAIARNVTSFMNVTPQAPVGTQSLPQTVEEPVQNSVPQENVQDEPVQIESATEKTPSFEHPSQPHYEAAAAPAHNNAPEATPIDPPLGNNAPIEQAPAHDQNVMEQHPIAEAAAPQAHVNTPQTYQENVPAAQPNTAPEERDFQRRALPMESNNSILGNNWRDAVIAKAVGAETDEVESAATTAQNSHEEAPNGITPMHILLAEDNAINALLTRTLLEAEGHTVETVEDGVLAVEAMKTQKYDLIFMDMRMPNMDGLEATRKIRQLPNVPRELPIIALTANAFDDDRNACFDSGMNDFMTKPVSAEELSQMVINWTEKIESARNAA